MDMARHGPIATVVTCLELGLECLLCQPSQLVWYMVLSIMCTASLELLQQKLFGSKRYPSDLVHH